MTDQEIREAIETLEGLKQASEHKEIQYYDAERKRKAQKARHSLCLTINLLTQYLAVMKTPKLNWIVIVKRIRHIIRKNESSSLSQAKFITDFIRENFKPKKSKIKKLFKNDVLWTEEK